MLNQCRNTRWRLFQKNKYLWGACMTRDTLTVQGCNGLLLSLSMEEMSDFFWLAWLIMWKIKLQKSQNLIGIYFKVNKISTVDSELIHCCSPVTKHTIKKHCGIKQRLNANNVNIFATWTFIFNNIKTSCFKPCLKNKTNFFSQQQKKKKKNVCEWKAQ